MIVRWWLAAILVSLVLWALIFAGGRAVLTEFGSIQDEFVFRLGPSTAFIDDMTVEPVH